MTDLHTHILPGMDDGAQSVEEALAMLKMQCQQGVDTVALTPHFYRSKEHLADFLARREEAWTLLLEKTGNQECPELILGAEVAYAPGMADWPELEALCYQDTKILLVELPMTPWSDSIFYQLNALEVHRGMMPMIAHIDRYFRCQKKKSIERLLDMGYPVQVSADALSSMFVRRQALALLKKYDALLISDCHNLTDRKPNLGQAMKIAEKKLGRQAAKGIVELTDEAITDWTTEYI